MTRVGYKQTISHRRKIRDSVSQQWKNSASREKKMLSQKARWADPKTRIRLIASLNTPTYIEKRRKIALNQFADPITKANFIKAHNSISAKKNHFIATQKRLSDPMKHKEFYNWLHNSIVINKRNVLLRTPEARERARNRVLNRVQKNKFTIPEIQLYNILEGIGVSYKKQCRVLNCKPDAVITSKKICLFADGIYWHAHPAYYRDDDIMRNKKTAKFTREYAEKQTKELEKNGYLVLRFWDTDLKYIPDEIKDIISSYV